MQIRALILLSFLISGCSPTFDYDKGGHVHYHCPDDVFETLKKTLEETRLICASSLPSPGDSK